MKHKAPFWLGSLLILTVSNLHAQGAGWSTATGNNPRKTEDIATARAKLAPDGSVA